MGNRIFLIAIVSTLVALPLGLASLQFGSIVWETGEIEIAEWTAMFSHSGFWKFYGQAVLWLAASGFITGVILHVVKDRGKGT